MHGILKEIIERIEAANPANGRKLRTRLAGMDDAYFERAERYYRGYEAALRNDGKGLEFGVDCYLKLCADMFVERVKFLRTAKYSNTSYKEVEQAVYNQPEIMRRHMHGLAMAQFLWLDQYERLKFFCDRLPALKQGIHTYLEIGGGHGLYSREALNILEPATEMYLLDISASSLELARQMIGTSRINYILKDVFEYEAPGRFDFITIAEVIEHVENPAAMLGRVRRLLHDGGFVFLTTPINAPMIDHIYLFSNVQEARDLITASGFKITEDKYVLSEDVPEAEAISQKMPIMYAAFLRKSGS